MVDKKFWIVVVIIVIFSFILSLRVGWYATAIGVGIVGIWFGIVLFRMAKIDAQILLYLVVEVLLIWLAFSLAFCELSQGIKIDAFIIGIQNLFHFTVISVPDKISNSIVYKILASAEGFIGYLLVVSGVVLLFKERKENEKRGI
ncbi:MAG: hypothetical protein AB1393_11845 [Candidatus Edwardsbacteria bacterium]